MKNRIDEILKEQDHSRFWLAQQTGITYATIKKICDNNTVSMSFDALEKICIALNRTPGDILVLNVQKKDTI